MKLVQGAADGLLVQGQQTKLKPAAAAAPRARAGRARAADGQESRGWINEAESSCAIDIKRPSIFRVPDFLKELKREAYVPNRVSLGPYYPELQPMCDHKGKAVDRVKGSSVSTDIDFVNEILNLDKEIRGSYEEGIIDDPKTLSEKLSRDCCFFLEILTTLQSGKVAETYEPVFDKNRIEHTGLDILNDFLKLENQIPMIVVRKILQLKFNNRSAHDVDKHLVALYHDTWSKVCPFEIKNASESETLHKIEESHHLLHWLHTLIEPPHSENGEGTASSNAGYTDPKQSHHPLDWLHTFCGVSKSQNVEGTRNAGYTSIPSEAESPDSSITTEADASIPGEADDSISVTSEVISIHPARELRRAGINFIPCKIKEIRFDKKRANLYLPPIRVDDFTETLLRNLIAFEMCQPSKIHYVSRYVSLMDDLVDSAEDVALLRSKNIITNYLGSDTEIAELFNGLCKRVTDSEEDPFHELKQEVKIHCEDTICLWYADLVNEHFSTPWKCLALAGAIILLLLTILQTIFSILSVCK